MSRRYRRNRHRLPEGREDKKKALAPTTQRSTDTWKTSTSFTWCKHWREKVELLYGVEVFVSAWVDRPKAYSPRDEEEDEVHPDFGVYFDEMWQGSSLLTSVGLAEQDSLPTSLAVEGSFPKVLVPWIDRQAPSSPSRFETLVDWLIGRMYAGRVVEIGCFAAHGRTGTTLACLLVKQGMAAGEAIRLVRKKYCEDAIEGFQQTDFVYDFEERVTGVPAIDRPKEVLGSWGSWASETKMYTPNVTPSLPSRVRKSVLEDNEEDYREWLSLNARRIAEADYPAHLADSYDDNDTDCSDPPCAYPSECGDDGCWKAVVLRDALRNSVPEDDER